VYAFLHNQFNLRIFFSELKAWICDGYNDLLVLSVREGGGGGGGEVVANIKLKAQPQSLKCQN